MSNLKQTVMLTDARFYAYHGYYPEEQVWGNEFFVSIHATFRPADIDPDDLTGILNYEELYAIAKQEMQTASRKLLETLVERMLATVQQRFGYVYAVTVAIRKTRPPFGGDAANATVSLVWER